MSSSTSSVMLHHSYSNSHFRLLQRPLSRGDSLAQTYRLEAKIADLTYYIQYISNMLSSVKEVLELLSSEHFNFAHYQEQIIVLTELARKTLESSGVVLFLWASCPTHLLPQKTAYIELLRMLQSKEHCVDTALQKRLRSLLMPLTSTFKICPPNQTITLADQRVYSESSTPLIRNSSSVRGLPVEVSSAAVNTQSFNMLPPDAFPAVHDRIHSRTSHEQGPSNLPLWDAAEILDSSSVRRARTRSPRSRNDSSVEDDQENVVPEGVAFQMPRARQRFGIFLTGKSSMLSNYNRKERAARPTH